MVYDLPGSVKNYSVDPRLDYRTVSAINGYVQHD